MTKRIASLTFAACVLFTGAMLHAQGRTFAQRATARLEALERGVSASAPSPVSPIG
ncbi:MAG TPA: hypothetical protein VD838_12105 [Anaeromyxobacteraceae bacterium]|nr:hypothetical protein [Anaeromyxobacteraceae bacterium]